MERYHIGSAETHLVQGLFSISLVSWIMNKQSGYLRCNTSLDVISNAGGEDWNCKSYRQAEKRV